MARTNPKPRQRAAPWTVALGVAATRLAALSRPYTVALREYALRPRLLLFRRYRG
jgi:hypothetical protein